jgi:two-component system CheB/CheR fusion protein
MSTSPPPKPVNILLVDDQPGKLLSYEAMLGSLGENLIRANSGDEALQQLLKTDIAVVLMDVCMPDVDGFEVAAMIRKHPRFQKTAIIHVSAVNLSDVDRLKGYDSGAVDYVSVPVVPEVLRAKVRVFADLYRKTEELERLNRELETRVSERTQQFEATAARLHQTEERFELLAETIPSIAWTAGPDGAITYANQRWFDYCGITPTSETLWPSLVLHPEDQERRETLWRQALAEGHEFEVEVRKRRHDGVYRWFLTRAVPHADASGQVIGWFGVTTDIHDQKVLGEQLREADRRKDEFLATLAHELRNPLAALNSAMQVLRHPRRSEEQGRTAQEMIERQATHLARLVDDLVDVNRIARDKLELRRERIDLAEVVRTAVEACQSLGDGGRLVTVALPLGPVVLEADGIRLTQVLLNLLTNAVKYTAPTGKVEIFAEANDTGVVIRVKDDGIGVDPAALPRLFDMFYQVDRSLERTSTGLGIGLTLARSLVELHGGTIVIQSEGLGKGCEAVVRLPRSAKLASVAYGGSDSTGAAAHPRGRRVLVADDNVDAALSMAVLLRLSGHDVETASDGEEALAAAERFLPEVMLLDLAMPRLNGYEVAGRIRRASWGQGILLIALTGWAQEEDRRRTREAGFDIHLVKPASPPELLQILATAARPKAPSIS